MKIRRPHGSYSPHAQTPARQSPGMHQRFDDAPASPIVLERQTKKATRPQKRGANGSDAAAMI